MACQGKGPIIVISGQPGSGKSTYARRLADDLGLRYFTTGQAFRELAKRLGMNLMELNEAAERDPSIDL
ncbi:MAG: AAA family ATPase, partial [Acidilobus sp.]|nr:AAA family ATPase [Acidilobus sp.]